MANSLLQFPNTFRNFSVSASSNGAPSSVPQAGGPVILELPLDKIRRPLMRTRSNDPLKVKELMDSISQIGLQVPIDVLEVDGAYYGMPLSCIHWELLNMNPSSSQRIRAHLVSLVVTGLKPTSGWGFQQSVAKYDVELKKL